MHINNKAFRYILVGGVATIVDWSVFTIFKITFGLHRQASLTVAFACGTIVNYFFNKFFTFKCTSKQIKLQASTHVLISIVSLLCSMGLMFTFMKINFALYLNTIDIIDVTLHFSINKQHIVDHALHMTKEQLTLYTEIICRMGVTLTMLVINFFMHKNITFNKRLFK